MLESPRLWGLVTRKTTALSSFFRASLNRTHHFFSGGNCVTLNGTPDWIMNPRAGCLAFSPMTYWNTVFIQIPVEEGSFCILWTKSKENNRESHTPAVSSLFYNIRRILMSEPET